MSLIESGSGLRVEDFPGQKDWIGKLFLPLNIFLTSATKAINGNITFGDNIPSVTQTLTFTYGGARDYPKRFKWALPIKPVEVRVCQATEDGEPIAMTLAWSYAENQVSIKYFVRLADTGAQELIERSNYVVTVRATP